MLSLKRKCRKSSHKARAQDVCSGTKPERGHVRGGKGKFFSEKVSIVMRVMCPRLLTPSSSRVSPSVVR